MRLIRYNPVNELSVFKNAFDDFFTDSLFKTKEVKNWAPAVDILDKGDAVELKVEIPGMKKEEISVNIEDRVLTISGEHKAETEEKKGRYYRRERKTGSFKRTFALSDELLADEVTADYRDGILTITLKKNAVKEDVKQIMVN